MRHKMKLKSKVRLLLVFAVFQAGCGVSAQLESPPINSSKPDPVALPSVTPSVKPTAAIRPEDVIGCWSSGSGNFIRITDKQIFYHAKQFKPINYRVEKSEPSILLLRLIDRPQFYIFQEFILLKIEKDQNARTGFPLVIEDYQSREDIDKQSLSGRSGWVKSDCE